MAVAEAQQVVGSNGVKKGLPPTLREPALVQTLRWAIKPIPFLRQCSKKFGDPFTVRLAIGKAAFVSDPDVVKDIFRADAELFKAGEANGMVLGPILGEHSVLTLDGPEHLRQRKLMLPSFQGDRMRSYGDLIQKITEDSIAGWPEDQPFALHPQMQEITLNVIMRAVFGIEDAERLRLVGEKLRNLLDLVSTSRLRIPLIVFLVVSGRNGAWVPGRLAELMDAVDRLLYEEIALRRKDKNLTGRTDVLSSLLQATDDHGNSMTDVELRDELMTLLLAGHETTATALAWTFDLLFQNPRVMAQLRKELEGSEDDDSYIDAVCKESLRLRPVVPIAARRLKRSHRVGDYQLPEDTMVAPCIYLMHRRPDIYPNPEHFKPERFIDKGPETYAWIPFGGGIRRCLGASFALYEMRQVIKTVLNEANVGPADRKPEPTARRVITFSPKHGTRAFYYGPRKRAGLHK